MFGDELPTDLGDWIPARRDLVRQIENRLAEDMGRAPGEILVDYPSNPSMLELRLLLVRRRGEVQRLTSAGEAGLIDLPRLGRSLHHTTRVLRVFTLGTSESMDPSWLLDVLRMDASAAEAYLAG